MGPYKLGGLFGKEAFSGQEPFYNNGNTRPGLPGPHLSHTLGPNKPGGIPLFHSPGKPWSQNRWGQAAPGKFKSRLCNRDTSIPFSHTPKVSRKKRVLPLKTRVLCTTFTHAMLDPFFEKLPWGIITQYKAHGETQCATNQKIFFGQFFRARNLSPAEGYTRGLI